MQTGGTEADVDLFYDVRDSAPDALRDGITDFGRGLDRISLTAVVRG